jgi:hypothetical protein
MTAASMLRVLVSQQPPTNAQLAKAKYFTDRMALLDGSPRAQVEDCTADPPDRQADLFGQSRQSVSRRSQPH